MQSFRRIHLVLHKGRRLNVLDSPEAARMAMNHEQRFVDSFANVTILLTIVMTCDTKQTSVQESWQTGFNGWPAQ